MRSNSAKPVGNHEQKFNESISSATVLSDLTYQGKAYDANYLNLNTLKEKRILLRGAAIFLPVCLFGILAMYFPLVYAIFPVEESMVCACSFFEMQRDGDKPFII